MLRSLLIEATPYRTYAMVFWLSFLGVIQVLCSDFKRTVETAEVLLEALGRAHEKPVICTGLRERFFGKLELGDHERYRDVWAIDHDNDEHTEFGVVGLLHMSTCI